MRFAARRTWRLEGWNAAVVSGLLNVVLPKRRSKGVPYLNISELILSSAEFISRILGYFCVLYRCVFVRCILAESSKHEDLFCRE